MEKQSFLSKVAALIARFDTAVLWIMLGVVFLLPIFFIPALSVPFYVSKFLLLAIAVSLSLALWIIARYRDSTFLLPKHNLLWFAFAIPVVTIISALLSANPKVSLMGIGTDITSTVFVVLMFVLMFLVAVIANTKRKILYFYLAFLGSLVVVALFHLIRTIPGVDFLNLVLLTDRTSNLIGKWNDFGTFFGLATIFSLMTLEFMVPTKQLRIVSYIVLIISLFFIALVSFPLIWITVGLFSLFLFVHRIRVNRKQAVPANELDTVPQAKPGTLKTTWHSLLVVIISLVFILSGSSLGTKVYEKMSAGKASPVVPLHYYLSSKLNIFNIEVRPSWESTLEIAKNALKENPLLGSGPNRFVNEFLRVKPAAINSSLFWNTDFNHGIGWIPTLVVNTGIVGLLAWILFFASFIILGFKAIRTPVDSVFSRYILTSSFVASLYLWIFAIFYVPGPVTLGLTFIFTGLLLGVLTVEKIIPITSCVAAKGTVKGTSVVLLVTLMLVGTIVWGYVYAEKLFANVHFQKSLIAFNLKSDIAATQDEIVKAALLDGNDLYYRAFSELGILKIGILLQAKDIPAKTMEDQLKIFFTDANNAAQEAIKVDKTNYQNWIALGKVYEALIPFNVEGAYASAQAAYTEAQKLNPRSPVIYLMRARLELLVNNKVEARKQIEAALALKENYTEAIFLISQLEIEEGNTKKAIESLLKGAQLDQANPVLLFQLGFLYYSDKNYENAIVALERAVAINPSYSNARYFLGLSFSKLGKVAEAIDQFEKVKALNPDSKEVESILTNLKAGRAPFTNAKTEDAAPEKRKSLPVRETSE
jgi:tetratricopeptide (TPR) repeat protein